MKRIDSATRAVNLHGTGKDGFRDGSTPGTAPTDLNATWFNGAQEEICNVIDATGQTPSSGNLRQLLAAFDELALLNYTTFTSGTVGPFFVIATLGNTATLGLQRKWLAAGNNARAYSADGGIWTEAVISSTDLYAIVYVSSFEAGNKAIVMAGASGKIVTADADESPIANLSLTTRTPAASYSGTFRGAAFGAGVVVLVGSSGEIQSSADAITWTHRSAASSYSGQFNAVCFGNSLFVAVGASGEIQTSPDGITWTHRTAGSSYSGTFSSVAWDARLALFVACGASGEIQTSPDGTTWTRRNNSGGTLNSVVCIESQIVVNDTTNKQLLRSWDGITWRKQQLSISGTIACLGTDGKSVIAAGADAGATVGVLYRFLQRALV